MDIPLAVISGLVSTATLVGLIARIMGPERARRRASQAKEALDNAPAALRPAFERMHWEASVHLAAVTLGAASYGRNLAVWASTGVLALAGVGVFSTTAAVETDWDPSTGLLSVDPASGAGVTLFGVLGWMTLAMAGSIEGSRRRFYSIIFDKLYAREEPDAELFKDARTRDSHKWFFSLAGVLAAGAIVLVGVLGVNVGLTMRGTALEGAANNANTAIMVTATISVGVASWPLLLHWNRRPLHTLFSTPEVEQEDAHVEEHTVPEGRGVGTIAAAKLR